MAINVVSFILASENRKEVVRTLLDYPKRQWSCSTLEDLTKISHATVFRTLDGLKNFGILKSFRVNKKDILYELSKNPVIEEIKKILSIDKTTSMRIAREFSKKIKNKKISSIILFGSSVKGSMKIGSDIDILVVLKKQDGDLKRRLFNKAAEYSSEINKTISVVIMNKIEIKKEKNSQFLKSVKKNHEVIYGKKPF